MRGDPCSEVASRAVRRRNSGIKTGGHEGDSSWCQRANMDGWKGEGRESPSSLQTSGPGELVGFGFTAVKACVG